jgi:hypothetical protein
MDVERLAGLLMVDVPQILSMAGRLDSDGDPRCLWRHAFSNPSVSQRDQPVAHTYQL